MKPIEITTKFKPFSNQPGIMVPYPLLNLVFVIHPTKLKIIEWKNVQKPLLSIRFKFKSPCQKFTVFSDLIKQRVEIHCLLEEGFAKLRLEYDEKKGNFFLSLDRYNEEFLSFEVKRPNRTSIIRRQLTQKKPLILFKDLKAKLPKGFEKLFLGCLKKQEIEKIFNRKDIREFLPLWFLWGQFCKVPKVNHHKEGTLVFLSHLQEQIDRKEHHKITPYLKNIISSSFAPMMVPYLEDFRHWGFFLPKHTSTRTSPWLILSELYHVIRHLFVSLKKQDLYILPHLPPELFCGKLVNIKEGDLTIHLDWSKKTIRRGILFASKKTTLYIHFPNNIKSFRLRVGKNDKGIIVENNTELTLKRSKKYFLDRFEK